MLKPGEKGVPEHRKGASPWGQGFARQSLPVLLPGARAQHSKTKGSAWGGCSIPELPTTLRRGLCEFWVPSPEQDEKKPPYPPAKKGDKPGALAQMLRDSLLAGWILPVLAPGFFLEEAGCWQGGEGADTAPEAAAVPPVTATPSESLRGITWRRLHVPGPPSAASS